MKKIFIYFLAVGFLLETSCDDSLEITAAHDFDIVIEKSTYAVDEEITFQLSGEPGIITFYSGEIGCDYEYRNGRIVPPGEATLSFNNRVIYGTQPNQFSVLASTDYSGLRNIDAIKSAKWIDITDRFTLATTDAYVPAGVADLADVVAEGMPLYIAFRFIQDPATNAAPRTWNINNLALTSITTIGATLLANHLTGGFELFYVGPKETSGRSSVASGSITLRANSNWSSDPAYTEDWCVSKGFDFGAKDLGPDRPVKVKGNSDAKTETFTYSYTKPGTYKAYFVATNATIKEQETIIKEVTIEIIP